MKNAFRTGKVFDSLYYLNFSMDPDQLKTAVENMFRDPSCGKIFRIKGYIKGRKRLVGVKCHQQGIF